MLLSSTTLFAGFFTTVCVHKQITDLPRNLLSLGLMLFVAACYCLCVRSFRSGADAEAWITGYALEMALSVDDLFVYHLIFTSFAVPNELANTALSYGIYAAIVIRTLSILCFSALFTVGYAVNVGLGCLLIMGAMFTLCSNADEEVKDLRTVKVFKWLFGERLQDHYNGAMFGRGAKGIQFNLLFLVICILWVVDAFSALDAVGAKTKEIPDMYINISSSLMVMFTLRPLFFLLRVLAKHFDMVQYGVCAILVFVGADMILGRWFPISLHWLVVVIFGILSLSVVASLIRCWIRGGHVGQIIKQVSQGDQKTQNFIDDECSTASSANSNKSAISDEEISY